jgi:PadR family transcriptional regulator
MASRKQRRLSDPAAAILSLFVSAPTREFYGIEIIQETSIASGTLYPILVRLEGSGMIEGRWEDIDESSAGRPRRRYYCLSPGAMEPARDALREWRETKRHRPAPSGVAPAPA